MRVSNAVSKRAIVVAAVLGSALLLSACGETSATRFGCTSDIDCRAPRICVQGVCMNPPGADGSATPDASGPPLDAPSTTSDGPSTPDAIADGASTEVARPDASQDTGMDSSGAVGAVAKFCNNLMPPQGANYPLTIVFDTAPGKPRLTADSGGVCTPPTPQPCQPIPSGSSVPFTILDASGKMVGSGAITDVAPGDQWLLRAEADSTGNGSVYGTKLSASLSCSAVGSYEGADAGVAGDAGGDAGGIGSDAADAGAATCQSASTDPPCTRCVAQMCCTEVSACRVNASCVGLAACLDPCAAGDTTCEASCIARYPDGVDALNKYLVCGTSLCPTQCGAG